MQTLEKTVPIGSDWPKYHELLATDAAIVALKTASGDHPLALELLQEKRDKLANFLQSEIDERIGRYVDANNQAAWTIKTATPIEEYERLIAEKTVEADALELKIAGMGSHDLFQAKWAEIPQLDQLRARIAGLQRAIAEHPSKQPRYRQQPVPEFIQIT